MARRSNYIQGSKNLPRLSELKTYFFCGIGGSGMMPLALMLAAQGKNVAGSDRSHDAGQSPDKFAALEKAGIALYPQDGSGIVKNIDALIVSAAIEDSIPDIAQALAQNIPVFKRAELLADLLNAAPCGISVAGTSGKSTVTGMIATILEKAGFNPTVINGGSIRNFESAFRIGGGAYFVTETDESDGSIALYNPAIAVVNNIALDHKSMEELEILFGDFISRAAKAVILNGDDERLLKLAARAGAKTVSFALNNPSADLRACSIVHMAGGVSFEIANHGITVTLQTPGAHNVSNALAALAAAQAVGIELGDAAQALNSFTGIKRRLEVVGTQNSITVIDDFAHNPDKIAASLSALRQHDGRLLVMFQPHGFGPLKLMGREIAAAFAEHLGKNDHLMLTQPYYAGGTADRAVGSDDLARWIGPQAKTFASRDDIARHIRHIAEPGDRIVVMGARDDTLSDFAQNLLKLFF